MLRNGQRRAVKAVDSRLTRKTSSSAISIGSCLTKRRTPRDSWSAWSRANDGIIDPQAPRKILVGDVHQRIYGWRGAITDLYDELQPAAVLRLTVSFRFDSGVAGIASSILTDLKNESAPLWGIRKPGGSTVLYRSPPPPPVRSEDGLAMTQGSQAVLDDLPSDPMDYESSQSAVSHHHGFAGQTTTTHEVVPEPDPLLPSKITYICRTNHHVLLRAVRVAAQDRRSTLGCTISRANMERMIRQLTDAYYLRRGQRDRMKGQFKYWYNSWADFQKDLEDSMDPELHTIFEVIEELQDEDAPRLLAKVERRMIDQHLAADLIFTTLHKAKGLEFDHVELTNDFIDLNRTAETIIAQRTDKKIPHADNLNCLYVAITRAKKVLGVNPTLSTWLETNRTGSNRWTFQNTEGYCDRCVTECSVSITNCALHRDRIETICHDCAESDEALGKDPVVRWMLMLMNSA